MKNFFVRGISLQLTRFGQSIRSELSKIKQELEEHLQAINENTNEISANYEYVCEIESKLDRLAARVDNLQMFLESNTGMQFEKQKSFDVKRLNRREQEVFLVVYTLEDQMGLTYGEISKKLHISEQLVGCYITSMIEKGIPIIKRYINSKPYIKLDSDFKTLQAKENVLQVGLDEFGF